MDGWFVHLSFPARGGAASRYEMLAAPLIVFVIDPHDWCNRLWLGVETERSTGQMTTAFPCFCLRSHERLTEALSDKNDKHGRVSASVTQMLYLRPIWMELSLATLLLVHLDWTRCCSLNRFELN